MKNILILSPDMPNNIMGGLGIHLNNLLKTINTSEFLVKAICFGDSDEVDYINGAEVHYVQKDFQNYSELQDAYRETFLLQTLLIDKANSLNFVPDIVHIMDWSTAFAGELIANKHKAKIVFAIHLGINNTVSTVPSIQYSNYQQACNIELSACKNSDVILQVSNSYANDFPFNVFNYKTEVAYNGVNFSEFKSEKKSLEIGSNPIKIAYIGRMAVNKGVIEILNARIPENCDLIFMGGEQGGSNPIVNHIKSISRKANLNTLTKEEIDFEFTKRNFYYIGPKYNQEKVDVFANVDLIIMPSKEEPFGLVALEAMAAAQNGKTIVATSRVHGLSEFCNDENSLYCGPTQSGIEAAINAYLELTEEQKQNIRTKAVETAQLFSWEKCSKKIQNVWNSLISEANLSLEEIKELRKLQFADMQKEITLLLNTAEKSVGKDDPTLMYLIDLCQTKRGETLQAIEALATKEQALNFQIRESDAKSFKDAINALILS